MEEYMEEGFICLYYVNTRVWEQVPYQAGIRYPKPCIIVSVEYENGSMHKAYHFCVAKDENDTLTGSRRTLAQAKRAVEGYAAVKDSEGKEEVPLSFQEELEKLLNVHSMEKSSDTPDFILAGYLLGCLHNWNEGVEEREKWYGRRKPGLELGEVI